MASGGEELITENSQRFYHQCGSCVTLLNDNRTALYSNEDLYHGLVFSADPLKDDVIFEIVIDKKHSIWTGSIQIGVTGDSPDKMEMPVILSSLKNGTWVMSGIDIRKNGECLIEFYGTDLESLSDGDRVGVMRTSGGELVFYVNGESQGVAANSMPKPLWALLDLYGRCIQVTILPTDPAVRDYSHLHLEQIIRSTEVPVNVNINTCSKLSGSSASTDDINVNCPLANFTCSGSSISIVESIQNVADHFDMNDRIRFHTRCGSLVKLSPNCRSGERRRPLDEFNNGVVMTHRPLKDNELFEIRIDKLVDKWSGSIEVGVTTHNPSVLHFPATMTNMRSGTIMMSGCGILTNGKGTRRQYGEFNLDELREGDRIAMMRKCNGNLHYYINGQDQGVAATRVSATVWGVIDLYGMTIKVTIVDRDERESQNLVTRRNNLTTNSFVVGVIRNGIANNNLTQVIPVLNTLSPEIDVNISGMTTSLTNDRLTFHPLCGSHATVTHSGRTALRPNASDDFNNGVVLTRRPLRLNELFQVRLERVVTKWAGSVEMGVTIHSAEELDFPFTMTNVRSGTWMMTGNGVMHNGVTVIEQYGQNLDRLQVGDRVGVVRKDDGTLNFWVNGIDQGPAARDVPERVYGVIDLYGQAAQASIIDTSECGSPDTANSTISNTTLYSEPPLRFHSIHGKSANISNAGLTASRPNSLAEFNDAIVFSNRPLRQRELFEVVIETIVRHWSGNIEIGVIGSRPEDIHLASNATDLNSGDCIVLCGSMIFYNSKTIRSYSVIDLDTLSVGARVGVMRNNDFVHFFIDGVDQGPACEYHSQNTWAVINLYGQCAMITLTQSQIDIRAPYATSENSQSCQATSVVQAAILETKHKWTSISGNVTLSQNCTIASRVTGASAALSRCVVFSEHPLNIGSPFEMKILSYNQRFAGCLNIGITDLNLCEEYVRKNIPLSIKKMPANVWYVSANEVRYNSVLLRRSLASLEWLRVGDRITLELTPTRNLRILLNSEDMNIQFQNVPNDVYVVVELKGSTMAVQVISSQGPTSPLRPCSLRLQDSLEFGTDPLNKQDSMLESIDSETQLFEFSEYHGNNIRLFDEHRSAMRIQSYNKAIVTVTKPLCRGESISIKIENLNMKWKGTIGLGVVGIPPQQLNTMPLSIAQFKRPCWVVTHDFININGHKIPSIYGESLDMLKSGTTISMTLTHAGALSLTVGSIDLEELATGLPNHVYPIFDLYGKCEKISLFSGNDVAHNGTPVIEEATSLEHDFSHEHENSRRTQCEKADLEVHEKETEPQNSQTMGVVSTQMNRSVMESVSENLLLNLSIKNRSIEQTRADQSATTSSCCLQESLQLQHNTNLNIQRSQSTHRFNTTSTNTTVHVHDTNKDWSSEIDSVRTVSVHRDSLNSVNEKKLSLEQQQTFQTLFDDSEADIANTQTDRVLDTSIESSNNIDENIEDAYSTNCDVNMSDENVQTNKRSDLVRQLQLQDSTDVNIDIYPSSSSLTFDFIQSIASTERKRCEYMKRVDQFRLSLVLPHTFFEAIEPICFCTHCNAQSSEKLHGWVYFKLNQQTVNSTLSQHNLDAGEWLPLYYMTRVDKIRAILDCGQPLPLDVETYASVGNQKDEPGTRLELQLSPNSIGIEFANGQHKYITNSECFYIGTAFEVYVRRQSLCITEKNKKKKISPNDTCSVSVDELSINLEASTSNPALEESNNDSLIPLMDIKDMNCFTKEAGACIITALILKLEKTKINTNMESTTRCYTDDS